MPASSLCYNHGDMSGDAFGGGLRRSRSTRDYDHLEVPAPLLAEKVERKRSVHSPQKKSNRLAQCMTGALKCLGSFTSKGYREEQAAIFAIQEECAKFKYQEGPSQRGYRKRQEALHSVIAGAQGLEPCASYQQRVVGRRDPLQRHNSTPNMGVVLRSPPRDKGEIRSSSYQRYSMESKSNRLSQHKVFPSALNEPHHTCPKTSFLGSYMKESRSTPNLGTKTYGFQESNNVLPARPAEVVRSN